MNTCRLWGMMVGPDAARTLIVTNSGHGCATHIRLTLRFGDRDFTHLLSAATFEFLAPWSELHAGVDSARVFVPTLELGIEWLQQDGVPKRSVRFLEPFHR